MDDIHIINYNGKILKTKIYSEATIEEMQKIKEEYFKKPDFEIVKKQMHTIFNGGSQNDKITRYYFRDLMSIVQAKDAKWTVEDIFNCLDLFKCFKGKVLKNTKVFPSNKPFVDNLSRCIALGGKSYAKIPTNFPIKTADMILKKYNINNNWLDFSCGWGSRLTSALKNQVNYFGIEPNYQLVDRLEELAQDWHNNIDNNSLVKIKTQGSENFIPEWDNKMGLAFSSPPYFDLEDYKIGEQSYITNETTFEQWLANYLYPTLDNIYRYLIDGGILALNIKNIKDYPLFDLCKKYLETLKFKYIETETLKNIKRIKSTGKLTDSADEGILIYKKYS